MYYLESQISWCILVRKDLEVVSWMYIYVKWTRCQSNIAMHWPEEWHEAYRTLVCSKPDGWWWFCVLNDSTFFAWLYWPLFTQPTLALLQMLRRSFQEHVSHHIFRNLDLSSWQAILENHRMTDSLQSYEPSGYVSWPGDLCEEFLGSTKNQGQSVMAHPFSISDFSCFFRLMQATTPPAMVVISPPSASMSFIATLLLTGDYSDYSITTVTDKTMPCHVGPATLFCCTLGSAELANVE